MLSGFGALLAAALLAVRGVHGLIRFPCSQLVTERFDPYVHPRMCTTHTSYSPRNRLVTPGEVSPHLHQVVGGVSHDSLNERTAR